MEINRLDISERFADMWRQSRYDAGKSQEYMAKTLGVSKKTIQNWEAGTSCPTQALGFAWFKALGLQPLPYYLNFIVYKDESEAVKHSKSVESVDAYLDRVVADLTPEYRSKLLYILAGAHGSSSIAVIDMITAHLQTPLRDRVNIAQCIYNNYELAKSSGTLKHPDHVQPDVDILFRGISKGKKAALSGMDDYTVMEDKL